MSTVMIRMDGFTILTDPNCIEPPQASREQLINNVGIKPRCDDRDLRILRDI